MKRPALQKKQVVVLQMAFRARKVLGTFEKRAPAQVTHWLIQLRLMAQALRFKSSLGVFSEFLWPFLKLIGRSLQEEPVEWALSLTEGHLKKWNHSFWFHIYS